MGAPLGPQNVVNSGEHPLYGSRARKSGFIADCRCKDIRALRDIYNITTTAAISFYFCKNTVFGTMFSSIVLESACSVIK